ncbi:MAG TPA: alpha/beta fold hydrolase [bacterium]
MTKLLPLPATVIGALVVLVAVVYFAFPDQLVEGGRWLRRYRAGLSAHEVTATGHRIVYLEGGSGEPLVLLHGFGADKDSWPPIARILTRHYHVYAPDLPGFGDSTRDPSANYGFAQQAERVEAFAQAIGLAQPFHLGGNSMGGAIAGVYAARHPERLKSVWLIDPAGVASARISPMLTAVINGQNPMVVASTDEYIALMALIFAHPPRIPGRIADALARARAKNRDFDARVFADLRAANFALEKEMQRCPVPTLITWGDQDRVVDPSGATILGSLLPRATISVMPGVGHVPMIEQPQATATAYLEFRRGLK